MISTPIVIKGCQRDKWAEVQAIQSQPFVYIMGNGSKWIGEDPDDVRELLDALIKYSLDAERFNGFWADDPCAGVDNPDWTYENGKPRWIDGPRLYSCNGVVRFFGNFIEYSHGFSIDTNDAQTINELKDAIRANLRRQQQHRKTD